MISYFPPKMSRGERPSIACGVNRRKSSLSHGGVFSLFLFSWGILDPALPKHHRTTRRWLPGTPINKLVSNVQKEHSGYDNFTWVLTRNRWPTWERPRVTVASRESLVRVRNSTQHSSHSLPDAKTALSRLIFSVLIGLWRGIQLNQ